MPLGLICSFSRGIQGVCNWDGILDCSAIYLSALESLQCKIGDSLIKQKGAIFHFPGKFKHIHVVRFKSLTISWNISYFTKLCNFLSHHLPSFYSYYSYFQVTHLKYLDGEDIQESAMCRVSPDKVTTTMTYLTLGTTIVLYIFPIIFLPILYTK